MINKVCSATLFAVLALLFVPVLCSCSNDDDDDIEGDVDTWKTCKIEFIVQEPNIDFNVFDVSASYTGVAYNEAGSPILKLEYIYDEQGNKYPTKNSILDIIEPRTRYSYLSKNPGAFVGTIRILADDESWDGTELTVTCNLYFDDKLYKTKTIKTEGGKLTLACFSDAEDTFVYLY